MVFYVAIIDANFKCQVWNCSRNVSVLYTDFYITTEFTDNFARLNTVLKEFVVKDNIDRPFLNIKLIDLNRKTLPLYKRLDDKNNSFID